MEPILSSVSSVHVFMTSQKFFQCLPDTSVNIFVGILCGARGSAAHTCKGLGAI